MKKILIAGANGYIGARLSKLFALNGYSVTGICYPEIPEDSTWQTYFDNLFQFDLRDSNEIDKLSEEYYNVLINLVSLDHHQSEGDASTVTAINVTPTLNLLKHFSKKKNLKKFIYFSSVQVYGIIQSGEITETYKPNPHNIYGLTHYLAEEICNYYHNNSEIECVNVRLSNSYGSPIFKDNNCWWLVVNDLCRSAYYESKITLKSDGSPQRDFIHVDDIFNALKVIINEEISTKNIFHISSGQTRSILELALKVSNVFSTKLEKDIPVMLPDGTQVIQSNKFSQNYIISNKRLQELGFSQEIDLETGIEELYRYFSANE